MAIIDPNLLTSPVAGDDPCGADLDASGDAAFLNFYAFAPFQLPDSFFVDGKPFHPSGGFRDATAQIPAMLAGLMKRSRDLRLLIFLARFAILQRNLNEFVEAIGAIRLLLEQHWDGVHPRARDGSFEARVTALEELNDPLIIFSLQFVTLLSDRRRGNIAYRSLALAAEAEKPADGAETKEEPSGARIAKLSEAQAAQAFTEAGEHAVAPARAAFQRLAAIIRDVRAHFAERTAGKETPDFEKLLKVVNGVLRLFEAAFPSESASHLGAEETVDEVVGAAPCENRILNAAEGRRALESAKDYFCQYEPSSPALPLVAQALELQGKTFVEVLAVLAPDYHMSAHYSIGDKKQFKLAIAPLGELVLAKPGYFDERAPRAPNATYCRFLESPPKLLETAPVATDVADGVPTESGSILEEQGAETAGYTGSPPLETAACSESPIGHEEPIPDDARIFQAHTRAQALSLLRHIARYFRDAEPSSPIPWLIDRAHALAEQDFLSVLDAVFEPDAFLSSS
jgi:type VI secretion system protein ImpA